MKCPACHSYTVNARTGECGTCYANAFGVADLETRRRILEETGKVPRVYSGPPLRHIVRDNGDCVSWCEACRKEEELRAANEPPKRGITEILEAAPEPTPEELAMSELDWRRANGETVLVIVESPFAGDVHRNRLYLADALRDCLDRGEAPFASHGLYTLPGVLDDDKPEERQKGIEAGLAWGAVAHLSAVYVDLGITPGMKQGIARAKQEGRPVEYRSLARWARRMA